MKRPSIGLDSTVRVGKDQVSTPLADEVVILQLEQGVYYGLNNEVGVKIWGLLQQPRRVEQIRDALVREYEVSPKRCEEDLVALLRELARERLVEVKDGNTS